MMIYLHSKLKDTIVFRKENRVVTKVVYYYT